MLKMHVEDCMCAGVLRFSKGSVNMQERVGCTVNHFMIKAQNQSVHIEILRS